MWAVPPVNAVAQFQWADPFYEALFNGRNGWSLHDFWLRSTFGHFDVQFEIRPWRILRRAHAEVGNVREQILDACRSQARDDGEPLDGYDALVAFMHAPPCHAGAVGRDVVFDQHAPLPYYQHEIGHLLGFPDVYGPGYDDPYSVMGRTDWQLPPPASQGERSGHDIAVPPEFSTVAFTNGPFWRSDRVLSAAALYRHVPAFAQSESVVHVDLPPGGRVVLTALTHGHWGGTLLAVVHHEFGEFRIEYRARFGDDAALRPAVVVHSVCRRTLGGQITDLVMYEDAVKPVTGTTRVIDHDLQVEITDSTDREVGVYITPPG